MMTTTPPSSDALPAVGHARIPGSVPLVGLAILLAAAPLAASTSVASHVRPAPADVWCPTGLTVGEGRPGLSSSEEDVFDRGALETSFRSPANGWVYVTLTAVNVEVSIDNVLAIRRDDLFTGDAHLFDSTTCYRSADAANPLVRLHALDPELFPGGTWMQQFGTSNPDDLRDAGWQLGGAILEPGVSAVEELAAGDQAGVAAACPGAGAALCPHGTGSLRLPAGTRVRFPMGLDRNADYTLQVWRKGPAGARLDVRVDDFSSCPDAPDGIFVDHASVLEVEVLDAVLKRGIDPEIDLGFAFIEDQSDTFGKVTIDGESFDIPQIDGDDDPKWDGAARFSVFDVTDPSNVPVRFEMFDNDEFDNAHVDLDPSPGDRDLDLVVDLCRMQIEGDLSVDVGGVVEARGDASTGDDEGLLRFRISTPTGRPLSSDDLAVTDVDFVQVVHRTRFAITERPGLVMVALANNFATEIATEVIVDVYGPGGTLASRRFPVTLPAESTETFYLFEDTPIFPPSPPGTLGINVQVDPDGVHSGGLAPGDCRIDNDFVGEKFWELVEPDPLNVTWCKVGRTLELTYLVSDTKYDDVKTLGTDFIRATYPTATVTASDCPVPMPITPTFSALDFIATVLDAFEIPFSSVIPFALVWDMNTFATIAGMDKVLGVLPRTDWYRQFEGWENVNGNSLGAAAPHAAILLPEVRDADEDPHVKVTLAAHELAHTYGVSVDPRLKDAILCGTSVAGDPFMIGDLLCGATGGIDEYQASDPARESGNPATGFWVKLGTEDPRIEPFAGMPQCDRHCLMGRAGPNQLEDWDTHGRWIDVADWEHLLAKLDGHPDPELLHVSGMIDPADNVYLGPWFRIPSGFPDRVDGDPGGYRLRFFDGADDLIQEIGFPATFGASDMPHDTPPITFFGFTVPWNPETERIEVYRSGHGQEIPPAVIAERLVSANPPTALLFPPPDGGLVPSSGTFDLQWQVDDVDGDPLQTVVLASRDGDTWSPVHGWLEDGEQGAQVPVEVFPAGELLLKVATTDGIHVGESQPVPIRSHGPGWLFVDGFESGDTSAW